MLVPWSDFPSVHRLNWVGPAGGYSLKDTDSMILGALCSSLSKHMGDGKVKLGRGPYAISTAILSMYAGF